MPRRSVCLRPSDAIGDVLLIVLGDHGARPMAMILAAMPSIRSVDLPLAGFRLPAGFGRA